MLQQLFFGLAILTGTIGTGSVEVQDSPSASELITKAYDEWVAATNAKDMEQWSSFLAPQPVFLPPGSPALETKQDIIDYYIELFEDPSFQLECAMTFVEVAESGDMAWARGTCQARFTAPNGDLATGSSKWTKVWVRLRDGSWKCRLNTWNYNDNG